MWNLVRKTISLAIAGHSICFEEYDSPEQDSSREVASESDFKNYRFLFRSSACHRLSHEKLWQKPLTIHRFNCINSWRYRYIVWKFSAISGSGCESWGWSAVLMLISGRHFFLCTFTALWQLGECSLCQALTVFTKGTQQCFYSQ